MLTRDFGSSTLSIVAIVPNDLYAARSSNTTPPTADMYGCRNAYLLINVSITTDVPAAVVIQHSSDNSSFATHTTLAAATITALASTGLVKVELPDIKRYVKISSFTVTGTTEDSFISAVYVGKDAIHSPATGSTSSDAT